MEYWIFSKKELNIIVDLMVQTLLTLPDKSEISVIQLFGETIKSVFIKDKDKEGYPIHGLKLLDFKLKTGEYLSKLIKWDFKMLYGIQIIHKDLICLSCLQKRRLKLASSSMDLILMDYVWDYRIIYQQSTDQRRIFLISLKTYLK